jgi:hypothetical protein
MCLFCVCVVLCLGRGLATNSSLVQRVLPSVKMITKLKKRPGPTGAVETVDKLHVPFTLIIIDMSSLNKALICRTKTMSVKCYENSIPIHMDPAKYSVKLIANLLFFQ